MPHDRCPGQDQRFWKPGDIRECPCPHCGGAIEFWKDDPARSCPACGRRVRNPRFDAGCAAWCAKAGECAAMGGRAADDGPAQGDPPDADPRP
ncbi:MAG: hypothetical protein IMZ66_03480 [Planctomycetes bacterium]|nr:hypothetical protein [Planctomycetota bacterium]